MLNTIKKFFKNFYYTTISTTYLITHPKHYLLEIANPQYKYSPDITKHISKHKAKKLISNYLNNTISSNNQIITITNCLYGYIIFEYSNNQLNWLDSDFQ